MTGQPPPDARPGCTPATPSLPQPGRVTSPRPGPGLSPARPRPVTEVRMTTWADGPVPPQDRRPGGGWREAARRLAARLTTGLAAR